MAKYRLSHAAADDLDRLYVYGLLRFGIDRADAYKVGLIERLEHIADSPQQYPAVDDVREGYRRSVYGVNTIYYRVAETHVEIVRVLGRENFETAL